MIFTITDKTFTSQELEEFAKLKATFVVPEPHDDLREIYEVLRLCDLIGLRAEYYDSPEHATEVQQNVPVKNLEHSDKFERSVKLRNIQNPNFDRVVAYIKEIRQTKSLKKLAKLADFIVSLNLPLMKGIELSHLERYDTGFDIRFCMDTTKWFSYMLNRYKLK